jgi:hypothetical protein
MVSADENAKISQSDRRPICLSVCRSKDYQALFEARVRSLAQTRRRDEMVRFTAVPGVYLNRPPVS